MGAWFPLPALDAGSGQVRIASIVNYPSQRGLVFDVQVRHCKTDGTTCSTAAEVRTGNAPPKINTVDAVGLSSTSWKVTFSRSPDPTSGFTHSWYEFGYSTDANAAVPTANTKVQKRVSAHRSLTEHAFTGMPVSDGYKLFVRTFLREDVDGNDVIWTSPWQAVLTGSYALPSLENLVGEPNTQYRDWFDVLEFAWDVSDPTKIDLSKTQYRRKWHNNVTWGSWISASNASVSGNKASWSITLPATYDRGIVFDYQIRHCASDGVACSVPAEVRTGTRPPIPENVSAVKVSRYRIELAFDRWPDPSNPAEGFSHSWYEFGYSTDITADKPIASTTVRKRVSDHRSLIEYAFTGVPKSDRYNLFVRSFLREDVDGNDVIWASDWQSAVTHPAPSGLSLSLSSTTGKAVDVTWDASSESTVTGYKLQWSNREDYGGDKTTPAEDPDDPDVPGDPAPRKTGNGSADVSGKTTTTYEVASPIASLRSLTQSRTFGFRLAAMHGTARSDWSDFAWIRIPEANKAPGRLSPPKLGLGRLSGEVELSWWEPTSGRAAETFDYRYRPAGGSWTEVTGLTGYSATQDGLSLNTSYRFEVRARNTHGVGPWSAEALPSSITLPSSKPNKPWALRLQPSATKMFVSFTDADVSRHWQIQIAEVDQPWDSDPPNYDEVSGKAYMVRGLTNGKRYQVRVRGWNPEGYGPWSDVSKVRLKAVFPDPVSVSAGKEKLVVSWPAVSGS